MSKQSVTLINIIIVQFQELGKILIVRVVKVNLIKRFINVHDPFNDFC